MKYVAWRKTFIIISIGSTILMVLVAHFMTLDKKYISFFLYTNTIIQALVIAAYVLLRINRQKHLKIVRHQFENKFIKADMDIFPEYIFSTNPRNTTAFKIYCELSEFAKDDPPEFIIDIKGRYGQAIHDIKNHILNFKVEIEKDILICKGDIIVRPNENVNFKFRKDVTIKIFTLEEMYML